MKPMLLLGAFALLMGATVAHAETKVTLTNMHLCCGACVKAVDNAVKDLEGVSVTCDRKAKSASITASDAKSAQKAVDAITAAGFHGKSDNKKVKVKDDSGAKPGKVKRLELTGVHNCCGGCNVAVKKALKAVDGVEADTAKPRSSIIVVEGNFDAQELVQSLFDAGFHVKVKK